MKRKFRKDTLGGAMMGGLDFLQRKGLPAAEKGVRMGFEGIRSTYEASKYGLTGVQYVGSKVANKAKMLGSSVKESITKARTRRKFRKTGLEVY